MKNIVKIEPSPFKKSSVKVQRRIVSVKGRKVQYRTTADGKREAIASFKNEETLQRLPGTVCVYRQPLTRSGLATGLDEIVPNTYKDEDYYRPGWEKILKGYDRVRRQELLEYKHGKEPGYYTNQGLNIRTTSRAYQKGEDMKFFQTKDSYIKLAQGVTVLDLDNNTDEVLYYSCLAHPKVANSYEELLDNPRATHYIVKEEEKAKRQSDKRRKYNMAAARLEKLFGLSDGTIQDFCKALGIKRKNINKDVAYEVLDAHFRASDDNLADFNYFYDLWEDMPTRPRFRAHVELFNYLNTTGLITKRNNKYYWNQPDTENGRVIPWQWDSKEKVIEFLLAPEYQEEVEVLEEQLKSKTGLI